MIVGPLKSNIQASIIMLILLCAIAWISTFAFINIDSSLVNYKEHILYYQFFGSGVSFPLNQIITLVIILIGAFFVNFGSFSGKVCCFGGVVDGRNRAGVIFGQFFAAGWH